MTSCGSFSHISWIWFKQVLPPSRHWGEGTDSSAPRKVSNLGFEGSTSIIIYIYRHTSSFLMAVKFYVWNSYIEYLNQVYLFFVVLIIETLRLRWTCIWDTSVTWMVARWWLSPSPPGFLRFPGGNPYKTSILFHCYWEEGQPKVNMIINNKNCQQKTCLNPKVWDSVSPL